MKQAKLRRRWDKIYLRTFKRITLTGDRAERRRQMVTALKEYNRKVDGGLM